MNYLVFHDAFDGAMEVWEYESFERAKAQAERNQENLDSMGYDSCGVWRAYEGKLPTAYRTWKHHYREVINLNDKEVFIGKMVSFRSTNMRVINIRLDSQGDAIITLDSITGEPRLFVARFKEISEAK